MDLDRLKELEEQLETIRCRTEYVYRSLQSCNSTDCISLSQELENLYTQRRDIQAKIKEIWKTNQKN